MTAQGNLGNDPSVSSDTGVECKIDYDQNILATSQVKIGLPHEIAHGSLRLTLGEENTKEEMDFVVEKLKAIVQRLRDMSPLYEDFIKKSQAK